MGLENNNYIEYEYKLKFEYYESEIHNFYDFNLYLKYREVGKFYYKTVVLVSRLHNNFPDGTTFVESLKLIKI